MARKEVKERHGFAQSGKAIAQSEDDAMQEMLEDLRQEEQEDYSGVCYFITFKTFSKNTQPAGSMYQKLPWILN